LEEHRIVGNGEKRSLSHVNDSWLKERDVVLARPTVLIAEDSEADVFFLLRAFAGGALQPEIFALDESEMATRVEADLRELLGINEAPLFVESAKWERSMPQYEVGHLERVNEIEKLVSELPGLTLAGNAYRGAGIPDCIRSGEAAAEALMR